MATHTKKFSKKKMLVALTAALVILAGGAAFAYWTAGGSGDGTAATGTSTGVTVNQDALASPLAPGVAAQTLSGDFTNTGTGPVYVTSVTASIASVTPLEGLACTAADYTLTGAVMTVGHEVAVGTNVDGWTGATIAFNNTGENQDGCQGATVNLHYVVA